MCHFMTHHAGQLVFAFKVFHQAGIDINVTTGGTEGILYGVVLDDTDSPSEIVFMGQQIRF